MGYRYKFFVKFHFSRENEVGIAHAKPSDKSDRLTSKIHAPNSYLFTHPSSSLTYSNNL